MHFSVIFFRKFLVQDCSLGKLVTSLNGFYKHKKWGVEINFTTGDFFYFLFIYFIVKTVLKPYIERQLCHFIVKFKPSSHSHYVLVMRLDMIIWPLNKFW